jgi:hypothetical protein
MSTSRTKVCLRRAFSWKAHPTIVCRHTAAQPIRRRTDKSRRIAPHTNLEDSLAHPAIQLTQLGFGLEHKSVKALQKFRRERECEWTQLCAGPHSLHCPLF